MSHLVDLYPKILAKKQQQINKVASSSWCFSIHDRKGVKQRKSGGENEETDSSGRSQLSLPAHFLLKLWDRCLNPEMAQTNM